MVFLIHLSSNYSRHTEQLSSSKFCLYILLILNFGKYFQKCFMSLGWFNALQNSCLLRHLYTMYPMATDRVRRKHPPIIKRSFVMRPQKSKSSIETVKLIGVQPAAANLSPKMKPSIYPLGFSPNFIKGVFRVRQPYLAGQTFPPGMAFSFEKMSTKPVSSQTSMISDIELEVQ